MARDFDDAAAWAAKNGRPLYVGEFGSYQEADTASRVRWTRAAGNEAQKAQVQLGILGILRYFYVYDPIALVWR